jgi:hypothetical protein
MTQSSKLLLTIPVDHRKVFQAQADASGLSLSRWIVEQAAKLLPSRERKRLSEYRKRGQKEIVFLSNEDTGEV